MESKIAIIHTTSVTVEILNAIAQKMIPECKIINFMDDSILPQLIENGGNLIEVEERWSAYARFAEHSGAGCILNACSSAGELTARVQPMVNVPIVRIDEAMAEEAVKQGGNIVVAATLPTAMESTVRLLKEKAASLKKNVNISQYLLNTAYTLLKKGDKKGYEQILTDAIYELGRTADVIVLAQVSMAGVLCNLPHALQSKVLASPYFGIEHVKKILKGK